MKKKSTIYLMIAVLVMLFAVQTNTLTARAEGEYYASWEEYKNAGNPTANWVDVANAMDAVFDKAKENFQNGLYDEAYDGVNHGYYGYYETTGFERLAMGYISGARKTEVELQFSACKAVVKNKGEFTEFESEIEILKDMIREDAHILDGTSEEEENTENKEEVKEETEEEKAAKKEEMEKKAGMAAFGASFSIMLREGFEAILIVGAIIAYLKRSEKDEKKRKKKVLPVYIGSVLGIVASFGMAALLEVVKLANTASQEIIEGVTALLAVVVLFYVSVWMLSKSEEDAWDRYIKNKVKVSSEKGSLFALAFTAFLAVFREGAEVVLFFQPMLMGNNTDMVWTGFAIGSVCLVFVYIIVRVMSIRIPLKPFFVGTSILMFMMSISFLGAGIKELIEGDVLVMTSPAWLQWIPTNDLLDVLGIYPMLETLIPQLILLVISAIIFIRTTKKNNAIHAEAQAKRAEEKLALEAAQKIEEEKVLEAKIREIVNRILEEKNN